MVFCAQSVLADYKDMLLQIFRYYAAGEKVSCMAAAVLQLKGGSSGPLAWRASAWAEWESHTGSHR